MDVAEHAAWVLAAAFTLSLAYELYRAAVKTGTSRHDSWRAFVRTNLTLYAAAALTIGALFADFRWAPLAGLVFSVAVTAVSILYYNPIILPARQPARIDWFETLVFTSLVFLAATLLAHQVLGRSLLT